MIASDFSFCSYFKITILRCIEFYDLLLFPNPAGDMVTVDLSGVNNAASVLILNNEGRLVARHDNVTSDNQVQLDISFLSPGIYFVQVVSVSGEMKNTKLIKL